MTNESFFLEFRLDDIETRVITATSLFKEFMVILVNG